MTTGPALSATPKLKIHRQYAGNVLANMCLVVAKLARHEVELVNVSEATRKTKEY